ncbi:DNA polymerase III subunit delta [Bacillus sp. FJAT-49736]|uniref:DNA polymerase III subunit delta n=1 Tax=Bacillus sp. FJAT-49736 TaxID=2833582 RepID=UPI001BC999C8|nr:DNA polymerase III subunit delta [Bacillus sp. FJAT-49736]MBS4173599.1 DNA polymerase III subunit delta [Bacillus sp. FJAT-49736]
MMIDIWKKIERKQFSPIYLLYGTESFLINETKQKLLKNMLTDEELDFNFASYDLEEVSVDIAIEDAETLPFMGERRLIFLHNPFFLTSEKVKSKVEHDIQKVEAYINEPVPYSTIVFVAPYEKLDERKKITKQLKRTAEVLEAKKLSEPEIKGWIRHRAEANKVEIDDDAVELLMTLSGTNLMMLATEVDKLSLYSEQCIDKHTVEILASKSLEQNIFSLVDKVINRKIEEALRIYYDLLKQNEEPIKILAVLANQFRLLYQTKELTRRGYGQQQVAQFLKIHPFRIKLAAGQAKMFTEEELNKIMMWIAESDYQMKSSGLSKEMIIEMLLFRIHDSL